jgi:serine/threonine-protein kinase
MVRLQLLGSLDLELSDGTAATAVLSQPKRVAILAFLAAAQPRGFHRRDELLALFWPERDTRQARNALRQAIHFLHSSLGDGVLVGRGGEEIGLDPGRLECDVWGFEQALEEGRTREALQFYRGMLLEVFHLPERGFEQWLGERREELRRAAVEAALNCGNDALDKKQWADAVEIFRNALQWSPYDETVLRDLLQALWRSGDRPAALQEYQTFAKRLREELELDPSNETELFLRDLRANGVPDSAPTRPKAGSDLLASSAAATTKFADSTGLEESRSYRHPSRALNRRSPRWLRHFVAGAAVLGVIVVGGLTLQGTGERTPRLAVLPLQNVSSDPENVYMAAGLHEDILTDLSKIGGLEVIGRTSVRRYEDAQQSTTEIADELDADMIVEGSVQRDGDRVRVSVQLIDGASGAHLWAERYDRELSDVFGIQTDVAMRVAAELRGALTLEERTKLDRPTRNLEAHTAFWKGHYHLQRHWSVEHVRQSVESYRTAVELDPEFEAAWARLVWARLWLGTQHGVSDELDSARAALNRLEKLAPKSLETRRAQGIYLYRTGRFDEGLREFESLRDALPNDANVLFNLATLYRAVGKWEEATRTFVEALELDPVNPGLAFEVGLVHKMMRRFDEAKRYLQLSVSLDPSLAAHWRGLANTHLWEGDIDGARAVLDSAARHVDPEALLVQRARIERLQRHPEAALEILLVSQQRVESDGGGAWRIADAAYLAGRDDLTRAYADTLRIASERRRARTGAKDLISEMSLARANAYLGNFDLALLHTKEASKLAHHALGASQVERDIAQIYVIVGRHDEAVELISHLLATPGDGVSTALLRLDPFWDPLRERPDFQALLEQYAK